MICFELTTETPEEMITLLRGLNLEGTKNEPVYKVQKPTILRPEDVQTEEGLGEAPKKASSDSDRNPVDYLIAEVKTIANDQGLMDRRTLFKAAEALEIFNKYLQEIMGESVGATLDLALKAGIGKEGWKNE